MAAPWEKYAAPVEAGPADGPWAKYGGAETSSAAAPSQPYDSDQGPDKDMPVFLRRDNAFMRLSRLGESGSTFGLNTEVKPVTNFLSTLASTGSTGKAAEAYHAAKSDELQKRGVARDEFGIVPEIIAGFGSAMPAKVAGPALSYGQQFVRGLPVAAGFGAAAGLTSSDGTASERGLNALTGAGLGVAGQTALTGLGYGIGKASGYLGRAISDAWNPEQAAYRGIADAMGEAKVSPSDVRDVIAPSAKRATTDAQVSEIVKRSQSGQSQKQIATEMGLKPGVVADRLGQFADNTATPLNVIDAVKLAARAQGRQGGDLPVSDLAMTAAGLDRKAAQIAAERLVQRQVEQPGRIADHLDQLTSGPSLQDTINGLNETLGQKSRDAYALAEQNAQPFNLRDAISQHREVERKSAGDIKSGLSKAIDRFFKPAPVDAEGGNSNAVVKFNKLGEPVNEIEGFQGAREALDQDIASSMKDGRPTPLTRRLTQFRQAVTSEVRKSNPAYAAADDQFSGAKTAQKILERAQDATARAGSKQRSDLEYFNGLSNEQKDLYRTAYKQSLMDAALNTTKGGANPTRAYTSQSAQGFIRQIFEKKEAERLLSLMNRENVATETLGSTFSGSRTAPLLKRMEDMGAGAHMVGDLVTANVPGLARRIGGRVASGISSNQARSMLDILTNTDQSKVLPFLDSIQNAGKYNALASGRVDRRANYLGAGAGTLARNALVNIGTR